MAKSEITVHIADLPVVQDAMEKARELDEIRDALKRSGSLDGLREAIAETAAAAGDGYWARADALLAGPLAPLLALIHAEDDVTHCRGCAADRKAASA